MGRRGSVLRLHFGDPGQYKLRIISMREQHFRSDFARGRLADRTNRTVRRAASCRRSAATLSCSWPALLSTLVGDEMLVGCEEEHPVTEAPTPVRVQRIEVGLPPRPGPIPASCVRATKESADCVRLSDGTSNREIEGTQPMNRMRISLFYLGSYLAIIGLGLLFVPHETLKILQSKGDYDDVFPRVAGMLMSGLGLSIFGMIRARASELYPATLFIRVYFIGCIAVFYAMTSDPLFLVLIVIVGLGFVLTLGSYLLDRKSPR